MTLIKGSLGTVFAASLIFAAGSSTSASAHAIIELGAVNAIAGETSGMTMEIQHGCITAGTGTIKVIGWVGKPWGKITPLEVDGWQSSVLKMPNGGQQITWDNAGEPQPFSVPLYLPMDVKWPKKSGIYAMKVTQVCPGDVTTWDTVFGPATANTPSPPITPLAQVKVLAKVKVS